AVRAALDQKGADAIPVPALDLREHDRQIGETASEHEALRAGEQPAVAIRLRVGREAGRRYLPFLAVSDRAALAATELRQEPLALFVIAQLEDRSGCRAGSPECDRRTGIAIGQLFVHDRGSQRAHALAAKTLRHVDELEPQLAKLLPSGIRNRARLLPIAHS